MIKKITKKEIPDLLNNKCFWEGECLPISKHRLYAHYKNPFCNKDDIVLLLAYAEKELVGYMGVFKDVIYINNNKKKIGWLSTWWVHPKAKGKGVGRKLLQTMFQENEGKIGVSQFTPSAKRVYEKSGYFVKLKNSSGYKFVYRSNLSLVLPLINSNFHKISQLLKFSDMVSNYFFNIKLFFHSLFIKKKLKNISLEYINYVDDELFRFISEKSKYHLCKKTSDFFSWLKTYIWVLESPLKELTAHKKYNFSMYSHSFNIYMIKILQDDIINGFVVLQKRDDTLKILFAYYDNPTYVAQIIFLHINKLKAKQLLCYDEKLNVELLKIGGMFYKRKKIKESIISKEYGVSNFDNFILNFGDGDCSFA